MTSYEEERSEAVRHADAGAVAWRAVVAAQRSATPDHVDFYALAGEVVEALHSLTDLATLLADQVSTYGEGRVLRDDEPGRDPAARLDAAWSLVAQVGYHLGGAELAANRFWSAIGHIGVEVDQ